MSLPAVSAQAPDATSQGPVHAPSTSPPSPSATAAPVSTARPNPTPSLIKAAPTTTTKPRSSPPPATPKPAPAPSPAPPVQVGNAPGTSIHHTQSRQVLVATLTGGSTGTYHGTWARYQWDGTSWAQVGDTNTDVRFGKNGVRAGSVRVVGSYTTPAGTYSLPFAFGEGNPGTAMSYRTITACSWWLGNDAFTIGRPDLFNRWYENCSGSYPDSEDLSFYRDKGFYRQAVVVAHNYYDPRKASGPGSSSAIFLHYSPAGSYTAGCIGLTNYSELVNTVRWLDPAQNPVIVIR